MSSRGLSPLVGGVVLLVVVVGLGVTVAAFTLELGGGLDPAVVHPQPIELTATENVLTLVHRGDEPIDVRRLRLRIEIDGSPLAHDPPVPFFSATGYNAGPTGAFNAETDPLWRPGEATSLRIATTNDPYPERGDTVTVRLFFDGRPISAAETTVEGKVGKTSDAAGAERVTRRRSTRPIPERARRT
ncbi:type IV pilin [Haloferacaceae archaeon DSL9]